MYDNVGSLAQDGAGNPRHALLHPNQQTSTLGRWPPDPPRNSMAKTIAARSDTARINGLQHLAAIPTQRARANPRADGSSRSPAQ